jgi:hypothetical protein
MIIFYFLQYLVISTIKCDATGHNSMRIENAEYTLACSKLTSQRISAFTVIINSSLNCFDEYVFVSFDLIDVRQGNKTISEQAFLTKNGCCLAERQVISKTCRRIRRFFNLLYFQVYLNCINYMLF